MIQATKFFNFFLANLKIITTFVADKRTKRVYHLEPKSENPKYLIRAY